MLGLYVIHVHMYVNGNPNRLCNKYQNLMQTHLFLLKTMKTSNLDPPYLATVKSVLSGHSKEDQKYVFKNDNHLMQVKSSHEHSAVLLTCIKLPHSFKTFVWSIFEWLLYP